MVIVERGADVDREPSTQFGHFGLAENTLIFSVTVRPIDRGRDSSKNNLILSLIVCGYDHTIILIYRHFLLLLPSHGDSGKHLGSERALKGVEPKMTAASSMIAGMPTVARTRVGNGSAVLEGIDGRTTRGRRYRDILDGFVAEYSATAESDLARCRAAATLALAIEDHAAQTVNDTGDPALGARLSTRLARVLSDLRASARHRRRGAR